MCQMAETTSKGAAAGHLVKQQPRFLRPNRILPFVAGFFAIEMMGVEFDGGGGIGGVQVHVVEVGDRLVLGEGAECTPSNR